MATKAELLEILESERWRTLGTYLDRTENRLSKLELNQTEIKNLLLRKDQSVLSRILQMLEKGTWKERLSILSVPLAALFFGYCLAASAPPDQVLSGLLHVARICITGPAPTQEKSGDDNDQ